LACPSPAPLQVHDVFQKIGKAASLSCLCVYGGAPYEPQVQPQQHMHISASGVACPTYACMCVCSMCVPCPACA